MAHDAVNIITLASVYLLFSIGLSLTWGTTGVLNFAQGSIFMFSAFIGYLIVQHVRLPMIGLLIIGFAVGAVMSAVTQVVAFDPILTRFRNRGLAELQILVAGIGLSTIPLAIAQRQTRDNPFGFLNHTSFVTHSYTGLGAEVTNAQLIVVSFSVVATVAAALFLYRSRAGLAVRAVGVDSEAAAMMGINQRPIGLAIMAFSGGLAGLAGVLLTFSLGAIAPETGDSLLIKGFAVIILGGVGSVLGVVYGAVIIAASETLVLTYTSGTWVDAISFAIIFVVLLLRPQGLLGRREVRRT